MRVPGHACRGMHALSLGHGKGAGLGPLAHRTIADGLTPSLFHVGVSPNPHVLALRPCSLQDEEPEPTFSSTMAWWQGRNARMQQKLQQRRASLGRKLQVGGGCWVTGCGRGVGVGVGGGMEPAGCAGLKRHTALCVSLPLGSTPPSSPDTTTLSPPITALHLQELGQQAKKTVSGNGKGLSLKKLIGVGKE